MGFLVITFSNMLSLRADRQFGVLGDGLGGRIHVGDIDVGELGGGNDASPIFGRIRRHPPRVQPCAWRGFGWAIGLCYRQKSRSDLLDGRMAELLTVHDPRGYPPKVVGKRLAERPESLDGKLVYLVDCLFDNSENFMRELADWFGKNLPSVETRLIQPRQSWVDDAEMRAKVAREGDGAILGVGL